MRGSVVRSGVVRGGVVRCGVVRGGVVRCGVVRGGVVRCGVVRGGEVDVVNMTFTPYAPVVMLWFERNMKLNEILQFNVCRFSFLSL